MDATLSVNEIFQSLQGEGPALGEPSTFVRLSGCNLGCAYCDTAYESGRRLTPGAVMEAVAAGPRRVVLTGGEPLLAGAALVELAGAIRGSGRLVDIETNGTIAPPAALTALTDNYVISPKLSNSGVPAAERRLAVGLPPGPLKFAVGAVAELEEAAEVVAHHPGRGVIIMPLGTEAPAMLERMELLAGPVRERGWRLLPRLQVLLGIR